MVPIISRYRRAAYRQPLNVEAARAVPILDVARRLDLGEPRRAGRELHVRCPLHEDRRPSMRLNPTKGTWFCDVCSEGGDSIRLLMRARGLDFPAAVRELAA
jgi:DNA primase